MKPRFLIRALLATLVPCIVVAVAAGVAIAAGNDFMAGKLYVNLNEVYSAGDYRVLLLAHDKPSSGSPDYTASWLSLDLAQYNGQPFSAEFSQVGLLARDDGIHWFVYAEPGVTCIRGEQYWGTCNGRSCGCLGTVGDIVSQGAWHRVELVTYGQGYWIARVYSSGDVGWDVAKIWSTSTRIYDAQVTMEEAYTTAQDPYLTGRFYHWHPEYIVPGSGFRDWPESEGGHQNQIYATDLNGQNTFCPDHYGVDPNWLGDERAWYAGTGGHACSWLLFPSAHVYLPIALKNYP